MRLLTRMHRADIHRRYIVKRNTSAFAGIVNCSGNSYSKFIYNIPQKVVFWIPIREVNFFCQACRPNQPTYPVFRDDIPVPPFVQQEILATKKNGWSPGADHRDPVIRILFSGTTATENLPSQGVDTVKNFVHYLDQCLKPNLYYALGTYC